MKIIEVSTLSDIAEFHNLVYVLYKNQKNWIPHIKQDVESVFDPKKNSYHKNGEITRFILKENEKTIGRIAVFYVKKEKKQNDIKTGGIGFFECINNQDAANILFDQSLSWLKKRKLQAADGPINFGEKEKFWGLMVEGFDCQT